MCLIYLLQNFDWPPKLASHIFSMTCIVCLGAKDEVAGLELRYVLECKCRLLLCDECVQKIHVCVYHGRVENKDRSLQFYQNLATTALSMIAVHRDQDVEYRAQITQLRQQLEVVQGVKHFLNSVVCLLLVIICACLLFAGADMVGKAALMVSAGLFVVFHVWLRLKHPRGYNVVLTTWGILLCSVWWHAPP